VAPQARDLGLGTRLKLYQRALLLPLGVKVVEWTYDPLEARNAHLNLNRLGAEVVEYVEDMYKGEMGSELARGIGTDRFIVAWRIAGERVRGLVERLRLDGGVGTGGGAGGGTAASAGGGTAAPPQRFLDAPAIEAPPAGRGGKTGKAGTAGKPPLSAARRVRIEVPARIQEFKERQPEQALAWRLGTRRAFQAYLARGYQVTTFWRDAAGRCWYGVEAPDR
jgi:predicted GNAT superfamily acetyltransferase